LVSITEEPTISVVLDAAQVARAEKAEVVIGFGGGSALDAAKAIAALATNIGDIFDHLEVIGRGQPLTRAPLPCIAIPTTAGTGSEVTRNAVLHSPEHQVKVSLRHPLMLPRVAIIDPELTLDLPPAVTASTGLDALTQLIEPYVSCRANPMTDALCVEGIRRAARSLQCAFEHGNNLTAREDMAMASLFGGIALANAGLGAVHGFAAPIGGMFSAPHGAVCAALLPHVMSANINALRSREPRSEALKRFNTLGRLLADGQDSNADEGAAWVGTLTRKLRVPTLRSFGIGTKDIQALAVLAVNTSSMKGNPIVLTERELTEILEKAL
jgi:alcohol dehydrogenase class IV